MAIETHACKNTSNSVNINNANAAIKCFILITIAVNTY